MRAVLVEKKLRKTDAGRSRPGIKQITVTVFFMVGKVQLVLPQ